MKTINLELSKKLNEAWVLDGVETEFFYSLNIANQALLYRNLENEMLRDDFKTLTLEETIELIWKDMCNMRLLYPNAWMWLMELQFEKEDLQGESLIEVFEKFLEYCLENDLLDKG